MKFKDLTLSKAWGAWLGGPDFHWDVFLTIHFYNKTTSRSAMNLINKINKYNSHLIDRLFYINEREKTMNGVHTHLLIQTNDRPRDLIDNLAYLKSFSHTHYELINDNQISGHKKGGVGIYISKFIDQQGIEYDLL